MPKLVLTMGGIPVNEYSLDKVQITIGRQNTLDIVLDDPLVSARHALIITWLNANTPAVKELFIQDLNSTNGTRVNGQDIKKVLLKHGDIIQIGRSALRFIDE